MYSRDGAFHTPTTKQMDIANAETLAFFATKAFDGSGRSDDFQHNSVVSAANRLIVEASKEGIDLGNVDVIDFESGGDRLKLISGDDTHSVRIKKAHLALDEPFSGRYSNVLP